jgi:ADP-ribose pyrophosphatase YjhB (NUDIX family)
MPRTEYYNDPNAPRANSIVVACTAFVLDDQDRVLMIQRSDNGLWSIPGGAMDIGETIAQTAIRETKEETGIDIEVTGIVGVYSNPNHVMAYENGEVRQQFSICFSGRPLGGFLSGSEEATSTSWVDRSTLSTLAVHPSIRLRISHGFQPQRPYIG